jgi:acetyl-CoA/propionyl-CoA carboxylase biotin carboxyl carrier protein
VEFRINAERVDAGFAAAPGRLTRVVWPTGPGVRIDPGAGAGDIVSGRYDSLIAKLVVTGSDRATTMSRARRALAETAVDGVATTLDFHRSVLQVSSFTDPMPSVDTGWVERVWAPTACTGSDAAGAHTAATGTVAGDPSGPDGDFERIVIEVDGRRLEVRLPRRSAQPARRATRRPGAARRTSPQAAASEEAASEVSVSVRRGSDTREQPGAVRAPLDGIVAGIAVRDGDVVTQGQTLVVLEVMKLQQPVVAPVDGVVRDLAIDAGAAVSAGDLLCRVTD